MSDLVKRLRDIRLVTDPNSPLEPTRLRREAADEIERLLEWQKTNRSAIARASNAEAEVERLRELVKIGSDVVNDFLPNIDNCALQDYGRLNEFLMAASALGADDECAVEKGQ